MRRGWNLIAVVFFIWGWGLSLRGDESPNRQEVATYGGRDLPQNCGVISLIRFCELVGRELSEQELMSLYQKYPGKQVSMAQIKRAAVELDIPLVGVKASLEELAQLERPSIIHQP